MASGFDRKPGNADEARAEAAGPNEPLVWLVDGYNVLHAGLLGRDRTEWWTAARRNQLLDVVASFDTSEAEVWIVFDGSIPEPKNSEPDEIPGSDRTPPPGVHRVFAPSADAWLVARLKAEKRPSLVAVVTADRKVADRSRHHGAVIVHPHSFLEYCRG